MESRFSKLKQGVPVLDGRFKLFVSNDGLEAYLHPEGDEVLRGQDFELLEDILAEHGIVYGLLDPPQFEPPLWIVARGRPPEKGEDAKLNFLLNLERGPKKKGVYFDFRDINALICVRQDEPIAQKIPARPGEPGKDVFGRTISPPSIRDTPYKLGKNVFLEEKTNFIRAACAGVLEIREGKIEVKPEYVLTRDVDWKVGHIRFFGERLVIQGTVRRGFKVYAEGDLEITGNVEAETEIEVKGNLIINGLVHGPTKIKCSGEAHLSEVEYAEIETGGSLLVSEYALQVKAKVGGDLIVTEGIGAIIGGEYRVHGSVIARILGSKANVKTIVRAGYEDQLIDRLDEASQRLYSVQQERQPLKRLLEKALELYRAGKLSSSQIKNIERVANYFKELLSEEESLIKQREEVLPRIQRLERARITIMSHVFPNVTVGIGRFEHLILKAKESGVFELKKNQILFLPSRKIKF